MDLAPIITVQNPSSNAVIKQWYLTKIYSTLSAVIYCAWYNQRGGALCDAHTRKTETNTTGKLPVLVCLETQRERRIDIKQPTCEIFAAHCVALLMRKIKCIQKYLHRQRGTCIVWVFFFFFFFFFFPF